MAELTGQRFRRKPTLLRAQRLDSDRQWRTTRGDLVVGREGDWLLTDEQGHDRTVQDGPFRKTHEHVEGDLWRRVGTVQAQRADGQGAVRTLEGVSTFVAGDWILTDSEGNSWPVTAEYLAAEYQPER